MKTVKTIYEVKEYLKDAKEVRDVKNLFIYDITKQTYRGVHRFCGDYWIDLTENTSIKVYDTQTDKLAEIISYKSTKDNPPKKEIKALLNLAKECLEKPNSEVCQTYKDKILGACPSLKIEIKVMKVGKWYKSFYKDTYALACCTATNGRSGKGYGFTYFKKEFNDDIAIYDNYKLSTDKEVEELLIAEAKKRGFKIGVKTKPFNHSCFSNSGLKIDTNNFCYVDNVLLVDHVPIFSNGNWAEIEIETISLSEAEKIIGKKIKID